MLLRKFNSFRNDIVFVDGMWGTGKSIIAPIISAMAGVEKQKIEYIFEYLCITHYLGKIESDAAVALLNTYADMSQYNNLIGREVNLRWHDDTGPKNNPNSLRYVKRLFEADGDQIVEKINNENLALNLMSHIILQVSDPLFEAFGERLKIIEMVRHPLYMVSHWYNYMMRFGAEREFTISGDLMGEKIPWFAFEWKDEYARLTLIDQCLASIMFLYEELFKKIGSEQFDDTKVLVLDFENFVLDPVPSLEKISSFLGRAHSKDIRKILEAQKVPRSQISMGKGHASYGWAGPQGDSEADEYEKQMDFIVTKASDKYLTKYMALIKQYNSSWPNALGDYAVN